MKKAFAVFSIFIAVSYSSAVSFAEDMETQGPPPSDDSQYDSPRQERQYQRRDRQEGMGEGREGGMGMTGGMKKDMMKGGMMGGMHQQVVATSDGGVVILSGGKIAKYDANLVLVNEVELKKDKGPRAGDARDERAQRQPARAEESAPEGDSVPMPEFVPHQQDGEPASS